MSLSYLIAQIKTSLSVTVAGPRSSKCQGRGEVPIWEPEGPTPLYKAILFSLTLPWSQCPGRRVSEKRSRLDSVWGPTLEPSFQNKCAKKWSILYESEKDKYLFNQVSHTSPLCPRLAVENEDDFLLQLKRSQEAAFIPMTAQRAGRPASLGREVSYTAMGWDSGLFKSF